MSTLSAQQFRDLLSPYSPAPSDLVIEQLSLYLDLLLRWNARTNLTAIRTPDAIVQRHFGESLFLALHLPPDAQTLLDLGSGAGFPGLPVQIALPQLAVTLAESQHKKVSFLREVIRELNLKTEVWPRRAEDFPEGQVFDVVAMRAVDNTAAALKVASRLLSSRGTLAHLTMHEGLGGLSMKRAGPAAIFLPLP